MSNDVGKQAAADLPETIKQEVIIWEQATCRYLCC